MSREPDRSDTDVFGERIGAQVTDQILLAVIFVGLLVIFSVALTALLSATGMAGSDLGDALSLLMALVVLLVTVSYSFVLETVWNGQTVGKRLFGIRVVSEQGEPIGAGKALVRNLPVFFSYGLWANLAALLSIATTDRRQRLFDRAAGTVVVDAAFDPTAEPAATDDETAAGLGTDVSSTDEATGAADPSEDPDISEDWPN